MVVAEGDQGIGGRRINLECHYDRVDEFSYAALPAATEAERIGSAVLREMMGVAEEVHEKAERAIEAARQVRPD